MGPPRPALARLTPLLQRRGILDWIFGSGSVESSASVAPKKDTLRALAQRQPLKGQTVLVRADLNLPLSKGDGPPTITDAKVVCCSHLGRPKKAKDEAEKARMKLTPIAQRALHVPPPSTRAAQS